MPIATKNNAIIVKDGAVAENCDCCGGWYCDAVSCYRCDLAPFPSICIPSWDATCTASANCKTMVDGSACSGTPISALVSGFSVDGFFNPNAVSVERIDDYFNLHEPEPLGGGAFRPDEISQFNGTHSSREICGYAGFVASLVRLEIGLQNGGMRIDAGYSWANPFGAAACANGSVAFQLRLSASLKYKRSQLEPPLFILNMSGYYIEPCIPIDSLPNSGSWLAGKSVTFDAGGTMSNAPPAGAIYSATKSITVTFS